MVRGAVLVARVGAAHGIRGEVRVKPLTADPLAITLYGPLDAADGRVFEVEAARPAAGTSPDMLVVRFKGIATRNAAEALNGTELFVPRERLPEAGSRRVLSRRPHRPRRGHHGRRGARHDRRRPQLRRRRPPRDRALARADAPRALHPRCRPEVDLAGKRVIVAPPPGLLDDRTARRRANELPRHRPHPLPRDVPGPARLSASPAGRSPTASGRSRRATSAPRDRPAPHRRRQRRRAADPAW